MGSKVNFTTHGQELKQAYEAVISESDNTNWLIYAYDKGTYDLRVQETGDGGLEELTDEFSDGKVQFAYARVIDPNTELPKFVFIAWCGSGVPELRKVFFNSHLSEVSKFFKTFHVQINARDEADVDPDLIMKRVAESSGANYSVHKETAKPQAKVTPVGSVYKKTEIPNIAEMQRQSMTKENAPTPVGTNYKPVQTAPKKLESRWNQATQQDSGAASVRAERERFEQEVREREMQRSRAAVQDDDRLEQEAAAAAKREKEDADRRQMEREAEERARREQERQFARQQQEEEEEAERQRQQQQQQQQQEEYERQKQEEEYQRQQQEEEEAARRRQRQEEEDRQRQQQEAERQKQQEAERQRQQQQQEAERQRQLEAERRAQEEAEAERQRQEEEQQALQAQLNQTADRAVHASQAAAASVAAPSSHQGVSAVVMFEYDASEANEMSLVEGEVIHQIDQVDDGWWFGVSEDGKKQGLFPANYVEVLEESAQQAPPSPPAAPAAPAAPVAPPAPPVPEPVVQNEGHKAVALYDYDAGEDNEVSFREGQIITEIEFVSEDWWQGVANGQLGLFPANYVELKEN